MQTEIIQAIEETFKYSQGDKILHHKIRPSSFEEERKEDRERGREERREERSNEEEKEVKEGRKKGKEAERK